MTKFSTKKFTEMYEIQTCQDTDDYDNVCFQPSNGGQYTAKDAIRILENGNGGTIRGVDSHRGFMVSYTKKENDWLRKELGI